MCSKCLVTEPVVRSFMFSRSYAVATALRARLEVGRVTLCAPFSDPDTAGRGLPALPSRPATGRWLQGFLTSVAKLNVSRVRPKLICEASYGMKGVKDCYSKPSASFPFSDRYHSAPYSFRRRLSRGICDASRQSSSRCRPLI